ncbi:MAG: oxidoreductase [Planctomycetes bacterium]|nr:oxidoreductase [Planctomycetota bacterium]
MGCACQQSNSIYAPGLATIVTSEQMTETERVFEIKLKEGMHLGHRPGQFVQVSIFGIGEAPISVSSPPTRDESFELVVRKVGNVTRALHALPDGSTIGIRGPFGTTFDIDDAKGKDILFVAGGLGLVPARSYIKHVLANRGEYSRVIVLSGTKSPAERLFTDELAEWAARDDVELHETVDRADDQWTGNVGVITMLFSKVKVDAANTVAVIVGPPIMYKFVIMETEKIGIPRDRVLLSLERRMKCGVGKCGHCQINNVYVCQDGPVFKLSQVFELREAIQ